MEAKTFRDGIRKRIQRVSENSGSEEALGVRELQKMLYRMVHREIKGIEDEDYIYDVGKLLLEVARLRSVSKEETDKNL
ncbi:hypothetical protein IMZ31_24310 (plasmid) [Pontibacillus sp. ALD_SL1]|uniref:hypothetical protein n=1 Tax=Pontibacillus sp. ALD_SL1 TaxID=2777185 RepID=UPI001A96D467|nr:hypothetical protein [Pontibacillus sp. ALD_SL1]QST02577.1 hypothetical protein IMZ31_24310 [Pontibacillus sp. ALD_SL1]